MKETIKMEDIEIRKESFDLKKFLSEMTQGFSLLAQQHNKQLEVQDLSETRMMEMDRDMHGAVVTVEI